MLEDDLHARILENIKRSGFISEMRVTSALIQMGWNTQSGETFLDKDANKSREIDVIAYKNLHERDTDVGIHLIIEVKKSEKPWIIFCHKKQKSRYSGIGWGLLNFRDNVTSNQLSFDEINDKHRHSNADFFGTSYYEAFKEPSENSQIYSALISACKAAVHNKELNSWEPKSQKYIPKENRHVDFFLPIIVLEGRLVQTTLDSTGNPQLEEIDYSPIKLNYSSTQYTESSFYPEIVTLNEFENHLSHISAWHKSLLEAIKQNK